MSFQVLFSRQVHNGDGAATRHDEPRREAFERGGKFHLGSLDLLIFAVSRLLGSC